MKKYLISYLFLLILTTSSVSAMDKKGMGRVVDNALEFSVKQSMAMF